LIKVGNLAIEMTNSCNLNCSFCYANSNTNKKELSIDQIRKAMDIVKPTDISFTGGEPLMRHDDIVALLPDAKRHIGDLFKGIRIETNGTLPIDFNKFTIDGKVDQITFNVSFDGLKENHDAQRGAGTWNKALDFIKESVGRGYWVTVKATLPDEILLNERDYLYDYVKYCAELGVRRVRLGNVKSSGRGTREDGGDEYRVLLDEMIKNVNEVNQIVEDEMKIVDPIGKNFTMAAFCGKCNYERKDLILNPEGILRLECQFLHVPLCHYTKYTPELHEMGLWVMKKNDMGITNNKAFDMTGRKSVFK